MERGFTPADCLNKIKGVNYSGGELCSLHCMYLKAHNTYVDSKKKKKKANCEHLKRLVYICRYNFKDIGYSCLFPSV